MRLFVAVRPPDEVLDALEVLARPTDTPARWTTRDQWHVTLRFLGNVDDPDAVAAALHDATTRLAPVEATLGPQARMLGRGVVCLPVAGLDEIAHVVIAATAVFGDPPDRRGFNGHLTLARTKGRIHNRSSLDLSAAWTVDHVELIRSHLGRGPARYETLAAATLGG